MRKLSKIFKFHKSILVSMPPLSSTAKSTFVQLRVKLHDEKPTKELLLLLRQLRFRRTRLFLKMPQWALHKFLGPSLSFESKLLTLERQKKLLTLESCSQALSKVTTLECQKGSLTLEPRIKAPSKVLTFQRCSQQESFEPYYLFMGPISPSQLEPEIVDMQPHFEGRVVLAVQ